MDKEKSQNPAALPDLPEGIPGNLPNGVTPDTSTELSTFRTRMSEHRTNMSEHRTDLSEHRTDLSVLRTHLSNERTHFSYVRTAVSLMSFGVTLNRFSVYLQENDHAPNPTSALAALRNIETVGVGMVILGSILLLWGLHRYHQVDGQIKGGVVIVPKYGMTILTVLIIVMGAASAIWMIMDK